MTSRRLLILLALALTGGGLAQARRAPSPECPPALQIDVPGLDRRLRAAEALWRRRGPRAYRVSGWSAAFASPAVRGWRVEVRPGRAPRGWTREVPAWKTPRPRLESVPYTPAPPNFSALFTVPALFGAVRANLRTAREAGSCGVFTLRFDPRDGHLLHMRSANFVNIDNDSVVEVQALEPLR